MKISQSRRRHLLGPYDLYVGVRISRLLIMDVKALISALNQEQEAFSVSRNFVLSTSGNPATNYQLIGRLRLPFIFISGILFHNIPHRTSLGGQDSLLHLNWLSVKCRKHFAKGLFGLFVILLPQYLIKRYFHNDAKVILH